jgi:hypothetical protein
MRFRGINKVGMTSGETDQSGNEIYIDMFSNS